LVASTPLPSLRRQWAIVALLWAAAWLAFYWRLRPVWPQSERWLALSAAALGYGLWVLWRNLPVNYRLEDLTGYPEPVRSVDALLPTLGPGNVLSLVRGLCIGLLAGFLFGPWPPGALAWVIVLLYTVVDVADYFDGYLARRADHVTVLGGALDMEFDGLGTLVVILLAVSFGQLPWWYLGLGLARYLFVFGLWLRRRLGRPIHDIPDSAHRRIFAGFQMGFLSVVLWPILPRPMAVIAGSLFAAATGLGFLRDWLVAAGSLDPAHPTYWRAQRFLYRLFAIWLPPVWRLLLVVGMAGILRAASSPLQPAAWRDLLAGWGLPAPALLAMVTGLVALLSVVLVGLGILPRLLSILLAVPIGFDVLTRGLQWDNALALVCATFIQLLGPGLLALWPAEERFMYRRLGGR
jgi:CDP-diacylglycerol--glycerol-3-phosphate 3-phosphatidyltransferase